MINTLIAIAGTILATRYVSIDQNKLKDDINFIKNNISIKQTDTQNNSENINKEEV